MGCNHSRESVAPRVYAVEEVQHSPVHRAEADAEGFMSITRKLEADFGSSPANRARRPDYESRSAAQDQAFDKWLARQRMMHERRRTHLPSSPDGSVVASPEASCTAVEAAVEPLPVSRPCAYEYLSSCAALPPYGYLKAESSWRALNLEVNLS